MAVIKQPPFQGGMNTTDDPRFVKPTQAYMMKNMDVVGDANPKRKGIATFSNEISSSGRITGMVPFSTSNGSVDQVVCGHGTQLYQTNSDSINWSSIHTGLTDDSPFHAITFLDNLYIVNGADGDFYGWDGSSMTTYSDPFGDAKAPKYIAGGLDRILMIATDDKVHYSNIADHTDFTGGDSGVVGEAATEIPAFNRVDDDTMTGIYFVKNKFFIFKNRSIWVTSFDTSGVAYVRNVSSQVGCVSQRTIDEKDGLLIFLSENGVRWLDPLNEQVLLVDEFKGDLTKYIRTDIIDEITTTSRCCSYYHAKTGRYLLGLNLGTTNDIIMAHHILEDELPWTMYFSSYTRPTVFCEFNGSLLFGSESSGQVYEMEQSNYNDNGDPIKWELEFQKNVNAQGQRVTEADKTFDAIRFQALVDIDAPITITASTNLQPTPVSDSFTFDHNFDGTAGNPLGQGVLGQEPLGGGYHEPFDEQQFMHERMGIGKSGQFITINMTNNVVGDYVSLLSYAFEIKNLPSTYLGA